MRSRTEARYAAAMDYMGSEWEYEPQAFASVDGQYLPDFRVDGRVWIEIKGPPIFTADATADVAERTILGLWNRMAIILESLPEASLLLFLDGDGLLCRRRGIDARWDMNALDARWPGRAGKALFLPLAPPDARELYRLAQYSPSAFS
jgi:hypothetical protein